MTPPPVLSTCPLHTNSRCGEKRQVLDDAWGPAKAATVRNPLEVYWPSAGGLSAASAVGTQLRDPQLRTGGVHCRESAGTGPVVLKVVPVTGAVSLKVTMNQLMCASLSPHPPVL